MNSGEISTQNQSFNGPLLEIEITAQTFRYSMLVAVCTFLEESIKFITKQVIPDYHVRVKKLKRGSWLGKHLQMLASQAGLDIKLIEREQMKFEDVILVRNTIAHAWGRVDACKYTPRLREVVARYDWVEITGDGFLELTDQAIPDAMTAALEITEHILRLPGADAITL